MRISYRINAITQSIVNTINKCVTSILDKQVQILHPDQVKLHEIPSYIDKIVVSDFPFRFDFDLIAIEKLQIPETGNEYHSLPTFTISNICDIVTHKYDFTISNFDLVAKGQVYGIPYQSVTTSTFDTTTDINTITFNFTNPITEIIFTEQQ